MMNILTAVKKFSFFYIHLSKSNVCTSPVDKKVFRLSRVIYKVDHFKKAI